mmetsp:Transcript_10014/g.37377  ORF Transcript_10014/g.37377 Transcript_10014/m.37377 type:complete len:311 (-) Transcript_10014:146-1078(-)
MGLFRADNFEWRIRDTCDRHYVFLLATHSDKPFSHRMRIFFTTKEQHHNLLTATYNPSKMKMHTKYLIFALLGLVLLFLSTTAEEVTIENEKGEPALHDATISTEKDHQQKNNPSRYHTEEDKPVYRYDPWHLATDLFKASERYFDSIWEDFWKEEWHPLGVGHSRRPMYGSSSALSDSQSSSLAPRFQDFGALQDIAADVKKTDKEYVVEASVPGFEKGEIHVALKKSRHIPGRHILTISGEKKEKESSGDKKSHNYVIRERSNSFSRSFAFDSDLDKEHVAANLEHGVLKVQIPYHKTSDETHRIDVK